MRVEPAGLWIGTWRQLSRLVVLRGEARHLINLNDARRGHLSLS